MAGGNKNSVNRGQKRKADVEVFVDLQRPAKLPTTKAATPKPSTSPVNTSLVPVAHQAPTLPSTSSQPTQKSRMPTETTSIAGVFTDKILSQLHLGLLVDYGVLYCTSCNHTNNPQLPRGISVQMVHGHLWQYHNVSWNKKLAALITIVEKEYKVWPGQCNNKDRIPPPAPNDIVPPFPHLPILTRDSFEYGPYICPCCQANDQSPPCILTSKSTASAHMIEKHGTSVAKLKDTEWEIWPEVQTFHSCNVSRRYFRVNSALAPSTHHAQPSKVKAFQKYLNKIYARDTVTPTMAPPEGLTRESPFLNGQQWPKHLEKEDPTDLVSLVEYPTNAENLHFTRLGPVCRMLLENYMSLFQDTSSQILRAWLDSDLKTGYSQGFVPLESDSAFKTYSRFFTRFICLILRTYRRRKRTHSQSITDKPKYIAYLTAEQEVRAERLLRTLDSKSRDAEVQMAIHDLAVSCFAPDKPAQMTRNKFNNINYVFVMLCSIKADGSYARSGDLVTATSALQYMFRIILLKQAMQEADEPDVDDEQCIAKYLACLRTDDMIRPFSALKSLRKQLIADAAAHRGLGVFHWADVEKTTGVYQGQNISMDGVRLMTRAMYLKTKELLDKEVLKSLPYDVLKIHEIHLNSLQDIMDESKYGYSVWRDDANTSLHSHRDSLLSAFMLHPSLDGHFYQNTDSDGSPIMDKAAQTAWLEKVGEFSLHLMGCVQVSSGLSRRGQELVKMRNHNVQTRLRNLFKYGEYLIYILGYSKTTSQTGKDRLDVHALPPKISDMLLIFNTIVRPVAVQWLKELDKADQNMDLDAEASNEHADNNPDDAHSEMENDQADEDEDNEGQNDEDSGSEYNDTPPRKKGKKSKTPMPRYKPTFSPNTKRHIIQDELTFSWSGRPFTSDDLSRLFKKFSKTYIGIPLGIQSWRHIQEVIRRDLLGHSFEESDDYEDTFFHLQAGHTAKIAALFYAVKDGDRTLVASESVIKYITASKAMQAWLDQEPLPHIPGSTQDSSVSDRLDRMEARLIRLENKFDQMFELWKQSREGDRIGS
ncbi:hypothetical protein FRC11_006028 [Ceratobasidium sp. 423]|nr:hypothetical protein FRC11_006028 [Ceratobasidium sp. 423]